MDMNYGLNLDEINNRDRSFFGRSGDTFNQQGLRENQISPAQGNQFNVLSREATRGFYDSIIRPNNWRSILGTQPQGQSNYRLGSGEYSAPGSVRARSGLSGAELRAPDSIDDDYEIDMFGPGASFGGQENTFEFSYGDTNEYTPVARSGNLATRVTDRSGTSQSQAPYQFSEEVGFGNQESVNYGNFGEGSYYDEGQITANVANPSSLDFNNRIQRNIRGRGDVSTDYDLDGKAITSRSQSLSTPEVDWANELGKASVKAIAPWWMSWMTDMPELFMPDQQSLTINNRANADASGDIQSSSSLGLEDKGNFNLEQESGFNTLVNTPGLFGFAESEVTGLGRQNLRGALNNQGSINLDTHQNYGGYADTDLNETLLLTADKPAGLGGLSTAVSAITGKGPNPNFTPDAYTSVGYGKSGQYAQQGITANLVNEAPMEFQGIPDSWVNENINQELKNNFDSYKERFPGLYGNYADARDYVTRKYYEENPQTSLTTEQISDIVTRNLTDSPDNWYSAHGDIYTLPDNDIDETNRQNVVTRSELNLSGDSAANVINEVDIATEQQTGYQHGSDWYSSAISGLRGDPNAGQRPSMSTIDLEVDSQQEIILQGLGAQADLVNDLKYRFNDREYGATLRLQAQRFVNDLEQQLPQTRETQAFINSLRDNPELTSLFDQDLAPETIIKAALDYDTAEKSFSNKLDWEHRDNYQQSQVYDPTPDAPNSGDEVALANVFGDVRILDPGKLYDIGYTDTFKYTPDYELTAPMTTISNEYIANRDPFEKTLENNLYYFAPGQNDLYNQAAQEFINRRYNLVDEFDGSALDQLSQFSSVFNPDGSLTDAEIAAISEDLYRGGYSAEDFVNLQNLLQQEYDIDNQVTNPIESQGSISRELSLPEQEALNFNYINSAISASGLGKLAFGRIDPRVRANSKDGLLEKYAPNLKDGFDNWWVYWGGSPGPRMSIDESMTGPREITPEEQRKIELFSDMEKGISPWQLEGREGFQNPDLMDKYIFPHYSGYLANAVTGSYIDPAYTKALYTTQVASNHSKYDNILNQQYL